MCPSYAVVRAIVIPRSSPCGSACQPPIFCSDCFVVRIVVGPSGNVFAGLPHVSQIFPLGVCPGCAGWFHVSSFPLGCRSASNPPTHVMLGLFWRVWSLFVIELSGSRSSSSHVVTYLVVVFASPMLRAVAAP